MDRVVAVGVVAPARSAAQHLARQERLALPVLAVEAGVSDGFLIGRHLAAVGRGYHASEQTERTQQHERARVGGRRPFRCDERALRRKHDVEHFADAFVDADLGGAFGRVGEVAQDRRDPLHQKRTVGVVGRPVDRSARLRIGAVEIENDLAALLRHLERKFVQLGIGDAVVLDVIFPGEGAVGNLRQQLVAIDTHALVEDGLEARLDRIGAEAHEQLAHALRAHHDRLHLRVEIGFEHLGHAGIAPDDLERVVVALAFAVDPDRRDRQAFLEHRHRGARHRTGHAPADVVVMAERLDVRHHFAVVEHRHGRTHVRQMANRAFGEVRVVHQEHVARLHRLGRIVTHHRIGHRRIRAPGELAAIAVEQADAVVVRLADHR